ncbi:tyrosine-type recombinase/integrase [Pedobacter sp. PWIIR3]
MAVEKFLIYLQHEKRYSSHTIQSYHSDLIQFSIFIKDNFEIDLTEVSYQMVREYIVHLLEEFKMTESSISRKLSSLRSYYKYQQKSGMVVNNPMSLIRAPRLPKRLPVFIGYEQLDELLDSGDFFDESFSSVRNKAIIETLFGAGLRLSELLSLKDQDLDFYEGTLKVLGKRNKERVVPISNVLVNQLKAYIELKYIQKFNNKTGVLFVTDTGADAYPKLIYRIVQCYLKMISTQEKLSPHVLRHSYATSLLNKGADLNAIKELLGHASLAATQIYTHNSVERLKSIYKQAHPKA